MPFDVEATIRILTWMLIGAALVAMVAYRFHVPYAVALVLGALLIEETGLIALPHLEPNLLLFVLLPPLLFDASFRLDERELRTLARPVLLLAIPGTVATALVVGAI